MEDNKKDVSGSVVSENIEVVLTINDKKIPMNSYVKNIFAKIISAMVSTLKGVDDDWKTVKIEIKR